MPQVVIFELLVESHRPIELMHRFGVDEVIASDIKTTSRDFVDTGPFVYADVQDADSLARIVLEHGIDYIVHLASLLSGEGRTAKSIECLSPSYDVA